MSTTHNNLTFKRFTRQVKSGPSAVILAAAMAEQNLNKLKEAAWRPSTEVDAAMPPLNFTSNPILPSYDAYKLVTDYVEGSGKSTAYAGMVAYRLQLPADAMSGTPANVTQVALSLHVDRWLMGGVRIAAILSADETPPTDWDTLRTGDAHVDAQLNTAEPRADQHATITIPVPPTAAQPYLYIIVSLEDYPSVSPLKASRIEGGTLIIGQTITTTFDRSVAADPNNNLDFEIDYVGDSFTAPIRLNVFNNRYYNGQPVAVLKIEAQDIYPYESRAIVVKGTLPTGDIWIFAFVDKDNDGVFKSGGICGVPHNAPDAVDRTAAIPLNLFTESHLFGVGNVTPDPAYSYYEYMADSATGFPTIHWLPLNVSETYRNVDSTSISIKNFGGSYVWRRNPAGGTSPLYDSARPGIFGRRYLHIGDWLESLDYGGDYFQASLGLPPGNITIYGKSAPLSSVAAIIFALAVFIINYEAPETPVVVSVTDTGLARPVVGWTTPDRHYSVVTIDVFEETSPDVWVRAIGSAAVVRVKPPLREDGLYRSRLSADLANGHYKVVLTTICNRETGGESTASELEFDVSIT